MGVNPVFCLLSSTLDDRRPENRTLHLMDAERAVAEAQQFLSRTGIEGISPIARRVEGNAEGEKRNVVLIFLESLSAKHLQRFGGEGITPTLDSLWQQSLSFANFYSVGTHTNQGLYATLYGFPSIMKRNAMKGSAIPNYSGLPTVLQENGYQTFFFMTHEAQYDNMNAFFRSNGFEKIYAQEDYPKEKIANRFGVQDDFLFEYAHPILNNAAKEGRPFFASLLTITNHPPYVLPDYFSPRTNKPETQVVEYADWAVKKFMDAAAKEPWFDNTLFVFVGDHGKMVGQADCELPESYNHVPFMIYGTGITPEERTDFAGQVDIGPTLLSLLDISYVQNNFGINLVQEKRPCIFYSADNTVAARDSSHLYVYNPDADREFCYNTTTGTPQAEEMNAQYAALKHYCFTMLQATEQLVQQQLTTDKILNK
jgi:phosphoglycerol transferase MdoB-like AlkP superfamily enzyme